MINGTSAPGGVGYHSMAPVSFAGMVHHHPEHHAAEAANNSALGMGLELDDDDSEDEEKKGYDQGSFELARPNASEAIQNFVMPDGYAADFVPPWSKNRSIIFDCGIKASSTSSGKCVWFCLCSAQCQIKSSKGVGIAIKGAVTNCTNHLRDIHKIVSSRSLKMSSRKPEGVKGLDADGIPLPGSGYPARKRPHSLLSPSGNGYGEHHSHSHSGPSAHAMSGSSATAATPPVLSTAEVWSQYFAKHNTVKYQILAAPGMEGMAHTISQMYPNRFLYHKTQWGKFPDGTDNIMIGGFQPVNRIAGENVIFLASFTNNSTTLTQFLVMVTLLQSFIESLTVILPFYPVGTMERVSREGQVATASTYAQMFSNLPNCGKPTRLVIYDLHTLQNRFYLHNNAIGSLQTTIPLLIDRMRLTNINCIVFPDDGALKRFGFMFNGLGFEIVICGKSREGDKRIVAIQDGVAFNKHAIVIDDLAQTGSTIFQCGVACKNAGAASVSAFVAHAVFPNGSWRSYLPEGPYYGCFEKFFVTNSVPSVTDTLPHNSVFEVLDMSRKIVEDLDRSY